MIAFKESRRFQLKSGHPLTENLIGLRRGEPTRQAGAGGRKLMGPVSELDRRSPSVTQPELFDLPEQIRWPDGFGQISIHSRRQAAFHIGFHGMGR